MMATTIQTCDCEMVRKFGYEARCWDEGEWKFLCTQKTISDMIFALDGINTINTPLLIRCRGCGKEILREYLKGV